MKIQRRFTKPGTDPLDTIAWEKRESVIREPDGTVVFEMRDIEVPAFWSQVATDILAQKYFRKAGVPQTDGTLGRESSARQVVRRLASCWTDWGRRYKYFDSDDDAAAFDAEITHMLIHQMAAPNSPQWFNTGLAYAYGITGPSQGHYYVDPDTKELTRAKDSYSHPQPHACLPYRAFVTTPDGPIPIGVIVTKNLVGLPVYDRDGITNVTAVKHNGVKAVYRVRLANGNSVDATADHLVLCAHNHKGAQSWRRVEDLAPGIRLIQRTDTSIDAAIESMAVGEAALAGWLQGDGFVDVLAGVHSRSSQEVLNGRRSVVSSDKRTKLAQALLLSGRRVAQLRDEIIVGIDFVGTEDVYDIETASHNFLTNNVVVHNCFIQSVEDDLVNENGIMDLWVREARLFKYGSGTGTNFSNLRAEGEKLAGGGSSSGLMSFLKVGDRAAGAIKSGGTTRRAAKMVILDMDHPDIEKFINWKVQEEKKVAALMAAGYDSSYEGEAYQTVSGQNSNNSVRVSDKFVEAVRNDGSWDLLWRKDRSVARTVRARDLWDQIGRAAWACADPGVQYDDIINSWHTSPQGGRIRASNPCVTGDTLVATADGLRRIDSLVGKSAFVIGSDEKPHFVTRFFPTGTKQVFRLRTKAGYELRVTGDHKILTVDHGDVPASQLVPGERVTLCGSGFGSVELPDDVALGIGTALASTANEQEQLLKTGAAFSHKDSATVTAQSSGTSCYVTWDGGDCHKRFTPAIHDLAESSLRLVLRGLFTSDGAVASHDDKNEYVSLESSSLELLKQVQLLLLSFDIKSILDLNQHAGRRLLRISRSSRAGFEHAIGISPDSAKAEALSALNCDVETYADEVTSIEPLGFEDVYDLTESDTHHFVANGIVVHNCSEYMFLDDTACNLASINLMKFYDAERNTLDVEAYRHAVRLWTVVLEISVLMAQFPSEVIAQKSYEYRTLGLGYANLGTMLMVAGIPYDSPRALAISGAISAILTGESYAASAEMAGELGPFARFSENADEMLRVMRNHRRAAYNAPAAEYEELSVVPMGIEPALCPPYLLAAARAAWDRALELGELHGYRNAQATCIAPTGCLVGNSLVATDRGLVRLNHLGDIDGEKWQDVSFNVLTDQGERAAAQFYVNGVEQTRTITTASGYTIQGTPTHRIKVVDPALGTMEWKRIGDVQPSDIVALSMGKLVGTPNAVKLPPLGEEYWTADYTTKVPREMSAELAELVGYFMGDGSLHAKGLRFCVSNTDRDVVDVLRRSTLELFNIPATVTQMRGYVEVAVNSVPLTIWWEACGFTKLSPTPNHTGKGYTPRIPDSILAANDATIYGAFLRGLFEADGTVTAGVPTWSSVSTSFADDVRVMMLALGLPTMTRQTVTGWGKSPINVLRLRNKFYVTRFVEAIGMLSSRKTSLLRQSSVEQAARRDNVFLPAPIVRELVTAQSELHSAISQATRRHDGALTRRSALALLEQTVDPRLAEALDFFYDTVASNADGGEQLTYDLSVPSNVTYVANGFISHNTIGLLMDCDTTGIEPDFALVKFKKLAGGGYFKIINQSIPAALRNFGYSESQIDDIVRYAKGAGTLYGSPYINAETLRARGFMDEDLAAIERTLPTVFEIAFGFNQWSLGEPTLQRLGFTADQYSAPDFDLLRALGFTREEIDAANNYICGTMTIEGAPHLKEEHYSAFDCANKCGKLGRRFIQHMGHVRMMAAAQPFISGAISKTINMPNEATVQDIQEAYLRSWDLGLKSIALYRDGSKLSQPLSTKGSDKTSETAEDRQLALSREFEERLAAARLSAAADLRPDEIIAAAQRILANSDNTDFKRKVAQALERNRLPAKRRGWTQKAKIAGHTVFLRTGEYGDGTLGEIFVDLHKEGASFRSLMNCFAIAVSIGLQYGVPLEEFVEKFTFTRFEPNGFVDHPNVKSCTSVIDYIFRVLGMEYLGRTDFVQVKPEDKDVDETHHDDRALSEFETMVAEQQAAEETPQTGAPKRLTAPSRSYASPPAVANMDPTAAARMNALRSREAQLASMMGDAPVCDGCGSLTRRNGACYVCDSCGRSMGCS